MEELLELSQQLIGRTKLDFQRSVVSVISWSNALIGIKGARGVGKTTLLLQQLKKSKLSYDQKAYVSLDELYFTEHTVIEFGSQFYKQGGKLLVLDEVHKYDGWAREIKNLYDRYDDLQIYFTGSSILDITKQEGDLSRRALFYDLQGLSFREYLSFKHQINLPIIQLKDLIDSPKQVVGSFDQTFAPYQYFSNYLKYGYYPFEKENNIDYHLQLRQLARTIIEQDMAEIKGFDVRQAKKLLQLIYIIAQQKPFKPNISKLSEKTRIHRNSLPNYLYFLEEAKLVSLLQHKNFSISALQKPEKIFLENTNLIYALSDQQPNKGSIREVFVYNQLSYRHQVNQSLNADFLVDQKYTFEVGGKNKNAKQIVGLPHAYLIKDDLELPVNKSLPIWMFGLLY